MEGSIDMKNDKIKNIIIGILIIVIIALITIIIYNLKNKDRLHELTYDEVIEKVENEDSFVLCISRTTCSHCNLFKPKLKSITKEYNIDIYYIDIDKYTDEEQTTFASKFSWDKSTPTTIFLIDGKETTTSNRISGNVSTKTVIEKLKKNGFIEE